MATLYVDVNNTSGVEDGSQEHPYSGIQRAVDAASAGDTIKVAAGVYQENVKVNKAVDIEGAGATLTTVKALNEHEDVFNVGSDNVKISGFSIIGGSGSPTTYPNGISLRGVRNAIISNNIISNIKFAGVLLCGIAENNLIENNQIYSDIEWSSGIMISQARKNKIVNNTISKVYRGIKIESSGPNDGNVITKNTITEIPYRALEIWGDTTGIVVEYNNIYKNPGYNFYNCAVSVGGCSAQNIKAPNNYWGTTDRSEIETKIYDNKDNPVEGIVDYEPFLEVPFEIGSAPPAPSPALTLNQFPSHTKQTPIILTGEVKAEPAKTLVNIALNKERSGYPSPLETDTGYCTEYGKWWLVDGVTKPEGYWEGVAFTYRESSWWKEFQHITVDFGTKKTFNQVEVWDRQGGPNLWYRGENKKVEYWDGSKWVEITDGNWSLKQISYYENPVICSFSPVNASKVRFSCVPKDWIWISEFKVLATEKRLPVVEIFVNGIMQRHAEVNTDGSFSVAVDLNEGENKIVARAIDALGNTIVESQPILVVLDTMPPEPPILKSLPSTTGTAEIVVEGNAEPNSNVELFLNGVSKGTIKTDPHGGFALAVKLDEGMNEIAARAVDIAGNISIPSSPIFVLYQVHPLGNLSVVVIEGVGKLYARKLEEQGIKTVRDMSIADVFTLYKRTGISLAALYTWKRRAALVMEVKIDKALFDKILQMTLGEIIAVADDELSRRTNLSIEVISDLKMGISTLLVALDNTAVKSMKLEDVASPRA